MLKEDPVWQFKFHQNSSEKFQDIIFNESAGVMPWVPFETLLHLRNSAQDYPRDLYHGI